MLALNYMNYCLYGPPLTLWSGYCLAHYKALHFVLSSNSFEDSIACLGSSSCLSTYNSAFTFSSKPLWYNSITSLNHPIPTTLPHGWYVSIFWLLHLILNVWSNFFKTKDHFFSFNPYAVLKSFFLILIWCSQSKITSLLKNVCIICHYAILSPNLRFNGFINLFSFK